MRGRGHGRRATLVTATVLTVALLGAAAHADPGTPVVPGQGDIDRAKAAVSDRQSAAAQIQQALDAANGRLHSLQARAGLAAEAYDTAVAQAAAAARAADAARTRAATTLDAQHQAEQRLGAFAAATYRQGPDMAAALTLLRAGSLHDFAVQRQALANHDAAEALAVTDARQATTAATAARRGADQTAAEQRRAEAQAQSALGAARTAASDAQSQVAGIQAQQDGLLRQLAAAQGVEVGLERQREAGLAALAAQQAAARQAAAAAASPAGAGHTQSHTSSNGRGGTWTPSASVSAGPVPYAQGAVRQMLAYIYAQLGKPYVWGGAGPDVFDCSGLAMRGLEAGGWSFPHPAQWQYLAMHSLSYNQLRPGDLVFWAEDPSDPHTIYHEAIFIGNDRIIQAPHPGGVVEQQSLWINGPPSFYGRP
ncbi:NLP/P60 protein [Catenulispora acidiphila DSM 44928]|uniref:NLP/P60 protein n=1 Tax=Catenulispora acidiphila (strain DSM 44928 / JCM 14897 / NBRC 102108 / NRRL B-24433 / ID139908) TaxID=479433 RepID=C7PX07_CATAD|nr:NlpC/P60 family protein [Catenulispora acidiphila]ACU77264.1 NLP/P60 protein [Catenulispora acidiphila DSM 44928]